MRRIKASRTPGDHSSAGHSESEPGEQPIQPDVLPLTKDQILGLPVVDACNLTMERQITPTVVFSQAYVGNSGTHVGRGGSGQWNINQSNIVGSEL